MPFNSVQRSTTLYINRKLKSASSIIDQNLLPELVGEGLLISIKNGIYTRFNKTSVYIKLIPDGNVSLEDLERMVSLSADD